jgi:hypothetical protein
VPRQEGYAREVSTAVSQLSDAVASATRKPADAKAVREVLSNAVGENAAQLLEMRAAGP